MEITPQAIQEKIQKLVSGRKHEEAMRVANFRISFMHKINSILYHINITRSIKRQSSEYVDDCHKNGKILIGDQSRREVMSITHELTFKYTSLMEDVIYHTMSSIDNLPLLIGIFYRGVEPTMSFNSARKALQHNHTKNLEITKFINRNWDEWIENLHDFRGNIYHNHSKICNCEIKCSMNRTDSGDHDFSEQFIIKIPKKMREALLYPQNKEVEIEEFCSDVADKTFCFFSNILDIIIKDHAKK